MFKTKIIEHNYYSFLLVTEDWYIVIIGVFPVK